MSTENGRIWLVTGCSSGLGQAIATRLARETDHRAIITALDARELDEIVAIAPDRIHALTLDITSREMVAEAVTAAIAKFGRIDVLVNNAGVGQIGAIEEVSERDIARVMGINFFGTLNVLREVLPHLRAQKSGRIMTLTSMGGFRGRPGVGLYNSSKFALEGAHEALAGELAPLGIPVTMIEPGLFRSGFRAGGMQVAEREIADYAATVGKVRASVAVDYPPTAADPAQIAAAIIALGESEGPAPLRMQLGRDAVSAAREKLDSVADEISRWEAVADLASTPGAGSIEAYRQAIAAATK